MYHSIESSQVESRRETISVQRFAILYSTMVSCMYMIIQDREGMEILLETHLDKPLAERVLDAAEVQIQRSPDSNGALPNVAGTHRLSPSDKPSQTSIKFALSQIGTRKVSLFISNMCRNLREELLTALLVSRGGTTSNSKRQGHVDEENDSNTNENPQKRQCSDARPLVCISSASSSGSMYGFTRQVFSFLLSSHLISSHLLSSFLPPSLLETFFLIWYVCRLSKFELDSLELIHDSTMNSSCGVPSRFFFSDPNVPKAVRICKWEGDTDHIPIFNRYVILCQVFYFSIKKNLCLINRLLLTLSLSLFPFLPFLSFSFFLFFPSHSLCLSLSKNAFKWISSFEPRQCFACQPWVSILLLVATPFAICLFGTMSGV